MSNLSIVIPVTDKHELTRKALHAIEYKSEVMDVIIIDNGSVDPYKLVYDERIIRNDVNIGVFPAVLQGLSAAKNNIVLVMHNDVLIHETDFDARILNEFEKDPLLGIAGFFGGRGVAENGGRDHAESNMQGKEWGMSYHQHSQLLTGTHPAVVFDSLAMIYNKDIFYKCFPQTELDKITPHHFFDRIVTLGIVTSGFHALTIGIAFDHRGGGTSVENTAFEEFEARYIKEKGLELDINPDHTIYKLGEKYFQERWKGLFPIRVDKQFNLTYGGRGRDLSDL
jgi:glycosyltransferase involved in cell wall biosynthesis